MTAPIAGLIVLVAYALGCFSTGYYLVRWRTGRDLRQQGSGSTGARNVGRVLGRTAFALTMAADLAKGAAAVGLARGLGADAWVVALALLAVVAGHIWPLQLRLHGGKGVATALGGLLAFDPILLLCMLLLFAVLFVFLRRVSRSGVIACLLTPLLFIPLKTPPLRVAALVVLAVLIIVAHRKNILHALGVGKAIVQQSGQAH
jgi:acyl phosphate:glycerol-3-phosphate acyltransferase